jgi:hypothetical protein
MIRSLILRASAALASAAMVFSFVAAPAHAANITLNDSNCDSFSLSGTAPNQTLSCIVSNAPSGCTISGPTTGTINIPITLTATCATGSPNAWTWTGGNCAGLATQGCAANSSSVGQVAYSVTPRNNIGSGNTANTTVTWSNTPPAAPSGCSLGASTTSLLIGGGAVVLTASCTGGGAPTSYAWGGNNLPTPTATNVASTSITATTTFTVTPSNGGGNGNAASVTVNVAGTVAGFCGQYANVLPTVITNWGQGLSAQSSQSGAFGDNSVWVFKLTVPVGTPTSTTNGSFYVLEYQGPETLRQITISTQPCDFRTKDYNGQNGPFAVSNGTRATIYYGVGTPFLFGPAELTAGQTYYVNVRNWQLDPTPQSSCGQTSCNALMLETPASP